MSCRFQVYTCLVLSLIYTIQSRSQSAFPVLTFESYVHDEQSLLAAPDPSDYVGIVVGAASVSSTGAATFSVPIQVAPGTRGMQPDLAITYNSQSFNGLLGFGWNLNATSSITRGNDQYYVEAGVTNANLEIDDAFYLDGQRLVHHGSLPYGQAGSKYLKRQHDGSLITVVSSNSYGPESFKVDYDGGRTVFYNSTGSANWQVADPNGDQVIIQYLIDRVEDCHGNYMVYEYYDPSVDGNEMPLLKRIKYTGNDNNNISPYNEVSFLYSQRGQDKTEVYRYGQKVFNYKYLLNNIKIKAEGVVRKEYEFLFARQDYKALLKDIIERDDNGVSKRPTRFLYGDLGPDLIMEGTNGGQLLNYSSQKIVGDFNGDGLSDFVQLTGPGVPNLVEMYLNQQNTVSGSAEFGSNADYTDLSTWYFGRETADKNAGILVGDFNGDGISDLLEVHTGSEAYHQFEVFFGPYNNGWSNDIIYNYTNTQYQFAPILEKSAFALTGDVDGDGRDDVLAVGQNSANGQHRILSAFLGGGESTFNRNILIEDQQGNTVFFNEHDDLTMIDFDGDGNFELSTRVQTGPGFYVRNIYDFEVVDAGLASCEVIIDLIFTEAYLNDHHYFPADYNGDGITDWLWCTPDYVNWTYSKGTGEDYVAIPNGNMANPFLSQNNPNPPTEFHYVNGDFNGDGLIDLLLQLGGNGLGNQQQNYSGIHLMKSKGHQIESWVTNSFSGSTHLGNHVGGVSENGLLVGDFNGDGVSDLLHQLPTTNDLYVISTHKGSDQNLLKSVVNGFLERTNFYYETLQEGIISGTYSNQSLNTGYPYSILNSGLRVVSKTETPNGQEGYRTFQFDYEGAILNRQGLGFMGFDQFQKLDVDKNLLQSERFDLNQQYAFRYTEKSKITDQSSLLGNVDGVISEYNLILANDVVLNAPYKNYWSFTEEYEQIDYLSGTKNFTQLEHDAEGNLTSSSQEIGILLTSGSATGELNISKSFEMYSLTCNNQNSGIPHSTVETTTRTGETPHLVSTYTDFDNTSWNVKSIEKFSGLPKAYMLEYSNFDLFGNPRTIKKILPNSQSVYPRQTDLVYDNYGRWVINRVNPLGQSQSFNDDYDPMFGIPLFSYGLSDGVNQSLLSSQEVDGFGRVKEVTDVQGITTVVSYQWASPLGSGSGTASTSVDNAMFQKIVLSPGEPLKRFTYDRHGQLRSMEVKDFENIDWIKSITTYDVYGRVWKSTNRFEDPMNSIVETFIYDKLDRTEEEVVQGLNGGIYYSYPFSNGEHVRTILNSYDGTTNTVKNDPTGVVTEMIDNYGTVTKTYDSRGLKTISTGSTTLSDVAIDQYGRQESLTDPNAGTTQYDYNGFGELVKQTDANGNVTIFEYDLLGRLKLRIDHEGGIQNPGIQTDYVYKPDQPGLNRIQSESRNGVIKSYDYDQFDRISLISYNNSGVSESFTYDFAGRLELRDIQGLVQYKYKYEHGYLNKISAKTPSETTFLDIFRTTEIDDEGRFTKYTLSNGIQTVDTYDDYGYLESREASTYFDQEYLWEQESGNLDKRWDHVPATSLIDDFDYVLNRLESQSTNYGPLQSFAYDANGNIGSKWDAGVFTYQPNTNRVVEIDPSSQSVISGFNQDVSYTTWGDPKIIREDGIEMEFTYGPDFQRLESEVRNVSGGQTTTIQRRKYFLDFDYEIVVDVPNGVQYHVFYERVQGKLISTIVKETQGGVVQNNNPGDGFYATYTDYLGSVNLMLDMQNNAVVAKNFDAWGRERNPLDWTYTSGGLSPVWSIRGYTGHESLSYFHLVHMNGRLYDPVLGRMLSPDNFVQGSTLERFNRYSYALNNPMKYTDPDGEFVVAAILIGAAISGTVGYIGGRNAGLRGGDLAAYTFGSAVIGGISGGIGAGVGAGVSASLSFGGFAGGFVAGAAGGAAGGFVGGFYGTAFNNSTFGTNNNVWLGGLKGAGMGAAAGGLLGGIVGGVDAVRSDANFWNGQYNGEVGGMGKGGWKAEFLDEEIPAGAKPTKTGEIATTDANPDYGKYGWTRNNGAKPHRGVDYVGEVGDDVYSMYDGKVTRLWYSRSYGPNATRISTTLNGKYYNVDYGHLSKSALSINQSVSAGDLVGHMGRLGNLAGTSYPTHVHIAVWRPLPGNIMGFVMPHW